MTVDAAPDGTASPGTASPGTASPGTASHGRGPASPHPGDGGLVRVRLDLAYDGGAFAGWARQPGQRTVQGALEDALSTLLRLAPAPATTVAGRTDAGVHARGQVCHVDLPAAAWTALASQRNPAETALVRRLAGMLPPDVRVRRARVARVGFDARFSAVSRRYAYRLVDDPAHADPLHRHFVVVHRHPVEVDAMAAAAQLLVGEHDFVAFCRRREGATTVRRILRLDCERRPDGVVTVDVAADAFCHQMVRSVVGALVTVGEGRRDVSWPQSLLSATQRESAVPVMPAHGLTLEEVRYPPDDQLAARAAETRSVRRLGADVESSAHWEG